MPVTPGRPCQPTIHPRTRPEAEDYALKNRSTNDWLRHDGRNVDQLPSKPLRVTTKLAQEIATRSRGLTDNWFEHNPNAPLDPRPRPKCSEEIRDKVYGREEAWFKHDDNQNYFVPPKARIGTPAGLEVKTRHENRDQTLDWYRFEHDSDDRYEYRAPVAKTGPLNYVTKNARKIQGQDVIPLWSKYNPKANERPKSRLTMKEATEICLRDRTGTADEWFGHNSQLDGDDCGFNGAEETRTGSNIWGSEEQEETPNRASKYVSPEAKATMEKSKGVDMQRLLQMVAAGSEGPANGRKVRPEAEEIFNKSVHGMMKTVFDHSSNKDYQSPRPCPRAIRPEAQSTFEKNKGVMSDCLQGYPSVPIKKSVHKARPTDDSHVAKHSGSSVSKTLTGELPDSHRAGAARALKPEGEPYAERNKGTIKQCFENYGRPAPGDQRVPNLRTAEAHEIARRNHGSVDQLIC